MLLHHRRDVCGNRDRGGGPAGRQPIHQRRQAGRQHALLAMTRVDERARSDERMREHGIQVRCRIVRMDDGRAQAPEQQNQATELLPRLQRESAEMMNGRSRFLQLLGKRTELVEAHDVNVPGLPLPHREPVQEHLLAAHLQRGDDVDEDRSRGHGVVRSGIDSRGC